MYTTVESVWISLLTNNQWHVNNSKKYDICAEELCLNNKNKHSEMQIRLMNKWLDVSNKDKTFKWYAKTWWEYELKAITSVNSMMNIT